MDGQQGLGATGDLRAALHGLHFSHDRLDSFLEQLTVLAADATGGDAAVGVTVIRENERTTVAASDERTLMLDEIQYNDGDGPCLHCARTGHTVVIDDLEADDRWPTYQHRGLEQGLRASLSLPLDLGDRAVGAINMYVFENHTFDAPEVSVLEEFRDEASRALSLALRHEEVTTRRDQLHQAMTQRRVIDQALGILMARSRCTTDDAFATLRSTAQSRHVTVLEAAGELIREVTGQPPSKDTHFRP
jgi:GAF domain-containing protein